MRKLFLTVAFVLASAAAHAGESRGLVLAANDAVPAPQAAAPAAPAQPQAQGLSQATQAETPKPQASKPARPTHVRRHESDEAKARRIAARYGIYW